MSAAAETKTGGGPSTMRTLITVGTLAASFVGVANKARKAKGSTDVLDHADVIAAVTTFVVLVVRTRRGMKAPDV